MLCSLGDASFFGEKPKKGETSFSIGQAWI